MSMKGREVAKQRQAARDRAFARSRRQAGSQYTHELELKPPMPMPMPALPLPEAAEHFIVYDEATDLDVRLLEAIAAGALGRVLVRGKP